MVCGSNITVLCKDKSCDEPRKVEAISIMSLRMSYRRTYPGKNINEQTVNRDLMNKLLNSNLCIYNLFFINSGKGKYTLYKREKKEIWEETSIKLYIEYKCLGFRV